LETKAKLFEIQRPRQDAPKGKGARFRPDASASPEEALLLAKIDRVERDVLFDKYVGEQQWRAKRITLEKEYSAAKKKKLEEEQQKSREEDPNDASGSDDVNAEAERVAAEILAEEDDDDQALADLFSSLPVSEVDPITGKSSTVMNGADGSKVTIRDFGKWSGVSPMRALEEASRSRSVIALWMILHCTNQRQ
jgi:ATP-dependent RNA helicase DHX29